MFKLPETRITPYSKLLKNHQIDLRVKHDDEFPFAGGGNKARKSLFVISEIVKNGFNGVITTGSVYSNQIRVVSAICAYFRIFCHIIVIEDSRFKIKQSTNLKFAKSFGAEISYICYEQLEIHKRKIISNYSKKNLKTYFFDNSGSNQLSLKAYIEAGKNLINQFQEINWEPDYIIVPSGTGLTQLGLSISLNKKPIKIIGLSISRKSDRLKKEMFETAKIYNSFFNFDIRNLSLIINDDYLLGGYGSYSEKVILTIKNSLKSGLILDPIYTGKAFYGLVSLTEENIFKKNDRVLFWHTGSLFNFLNSEFKLI